jgi:formamidase
MRTLSVAALQTAPMIGDPDATADGLADQVRLARGIAPHLELILLPELHLSAPGRLDGTRYAERVAVAVPGPLTERVGAIAREHGLWIVAGSVYERGDDGAIHNTAPVLSPAGELVAAYRKVFTWQPHESCVPGTEFVTFEIPGLTRVGIAICYDGSFPETFRQLALMGAELVAHVSLTTTSDRAAEVVMARANAIFNQLYVVSVNAAAPAGLGRSLIVDPEGIVRQQAGETEEVVTDVLDLDAVTRVREHGTAGVSRMFEQIRRRHAEVPAGRGGSI